MAAVTAIEPSTREPSAVTSVVASSDAVVATPTPAAPAPEAAVAPQPTEAARSTVQAPASTSLVLAAPRAIATPAVTNGPAAQPTLAQYADYWGSDVASQIVDPGLQARMSADTMRVREFLNSCSFLGLFCLDKGEEQQILAMLNSYPPGVRGAFVERLANEGLLAQVIDRTSGYESSALNMLLRQSLSGISSPMVAAQVLERMYRWSDEATLAMVVSSLNATNSPAFADAVLLELVNRGVFMRAMPYWSPLYLYNSCDSFYGIIQQQSMAAYLESSRMQAQMRLDSVLSTFPPNSQAAMILRTQLAQQYSMARINDQLATWQCLAQPRYQDYYYQYYPDYYRDYRWFPAPYRRYPDGHSGTGLPPVSGPHSGTGLPSGSRSGTGLEPSGSRSGTGLPSSGTGLPSSPRGNSSGTGLEGSSRPLPSAPRPGTSGTGLDSPRSTPSYTPPSSSRNSGTGLDSPRSTPSYTPPSYTPPSYTPPSSSRSSGTGLDSPRSTPSYTPPSRPSYTPPSYTPPSSSRSSGTGLGGSYSSPSYSSPSRSPSYSSPSYSSPSRGSSSRGSGTGL